MDDIEKLTELLKPHKDKYKKEEIIKAIIAEGYNKEIAEEVANNIFGNKPQKPIEKKEETLENKEIKKNVIKEAKQDENKKDQEEDYFKEVDKNLEEFKKLIPKKTETTIVEEQKDKETIIPKTYSEQTIENPEIKELEKKIKDLEEKISNTSEDILILNDNTKINLAEIPRREWRFYRNKGRPEIDILHDQLVELRKKLKYLKSKTKEEKVPEINEKEKSNIEEISEMIYKQLKEENKDIDKEKVKEITKRHVRHIKEEKQKEEFSREELNAIAENIFEQIKKNPNIYEEQKTEEKKEEKKEVEQKEEKVEVKKEEQKPTNPLDTDLNLDLDNLSINTSNTKTNDSLNLDLDLNLNLDLNEKKKKKD